MRHIRPTAPTARVTVERFARSARGPSSAPATGGTHPHRFANMIEFATIALITFPSLETMAFGAKSNQY
ncbi:hypothetical protein [Streptomyces sp. NPDC047315]|uniref:hypothetical protein n=1 Tax=Streptomyces sp. NPDC047315 TaxID=3155142 RepID=UPI0033EB9DDD